MKNPCCYQNINSGDSSSSNTNNITIIDQRGDEKKETSFPSQSQLQNRLKTTEISVPMTIKVCVHTETEEEDEREF